MASLIFGLLHTSSYSCEWLCVLQVVFVRSLQQDQPNLMQFRVEFLLFVGMSLSETANGVIPWLASCKPYGDQRL